MMTIALAIFVLTSVVRLPHALALVIQPRQGNSTRNYTSAAGTSFTNQHTGLEYASSCIESKLSWANNGGIRYASETVTITSDVWTNIKDFASYETVTSASNSAPYTLCDGWPRIHGTTSVITLTSWRTVISTSSYVTTAVVRTPYPAPNCTILKPDCDILHSSWASQESAYNATISAYSSYVASAKSASVRTTSRRPVRSFISPICGSPTPWGPQSTVGPATCAIATATVQLLYWPVTKGAEQACQSNVSTTTMGPTLPGRPNTAEYWGMTLTSPTVYIALDGTWQLVSAGKTLYDHSRVLLPQSSSAVSSLCGTLGGGPYVPYAVNYADLEGDAPASAYRCQPRCNTLSYVPSWVEATSVDTAFTQGDITVPAITRTYLWDDFTADATENLCSTIWDDYRPMLSIPSDFSTMLPSALVANGNCGFYFNPYAVFDDPPKALIERTQIVEPSDPATTAVTSAPTTSREPRPGSTLSPQTPIATQSPSSGPEPTAQPTRLPGTDSPDPSSSDTLKPVNPTNISPHAEHDDDSSPLPDRIRPAPTKTTPNGLAVTGVELTATGGQVITATQVLPAEPVIIGSVTLTPGQTTSYDRIGKIVVQASGLLVDGTARPFSALTREAPIGAILTDRGGSPMTALQLSPSGPVVIGATTLQLDQSTSLAGLGFVSIAANGLLMLDGKHVPFSTLSSTAAYTQAVITIADVTFAAYATSAALLAPGVTLSPGGAAVAIAGHMVSMDASGAHILVDGTTQWVSAAQPTPLAFFTIDGDTYTANGASAFNIVDATLTPGGVATVDGTMVSLDAGGQYVVVNGVTQSPLGQTAAPSVTGASDSGSIGDFGESATNASAVSSEPSAWASSASRSVGGWALLRLLSVSMLSTFLASV